MLGVLERKVRIGHRDLRGAQVRLRVARGLHPCLDFAVCLSGQLDALLCMGQALLVRQHLDEPHGRAAGDVEACRLDQVLLVAQLGLAQRLAGRALATAFDDTAEVHGGFSRVQAAQRAGAGDILQFRAERVRRGQCLALRAGVHGPQLRGLRNERGVAGHGARHGFLKTQGFGRLGHRRQAGHPGKCQDRQMMKRHGSPPLDRY
jgi:hypothetical protein